jgi:hypothetical protein
MSFSNLLAESLLGVKQVVRSLNRRRLRKRRAARRASYAEWVAQHDTIDDARREKLLERLAAIERPPRISVLLPTYNPKPQWLREAASSIRIGNCASPTTRPPTPAPACCSMRCAAKTRASAS